MALSCPSLSIFLVVLLGLFDAVTGRAEVRVFIQDSNGLACVNYSCTAGEIVRAFALDVSIDRGQIIGISGFFRGVSTAGATGYGIFPGSFRDHIVVGASTNINWNTNDYTPLAAVPSDNPNGTLPGLNSSGVTLEFGGLWDPSNPEAIPGPTGTLCVLTLSQPAYVTVTANVVRGGIVSAAPDSLINPVFTPGAIGPAVISAAVQNGITTVLFNGGELQTASAVSGPWTGTGDVSGTYTEPFQTNQTRFYRVRSP